MFKLLYECKVCSSFAFEDWIESAAEIPEKGKVLALCMSVLCVVRERPHVIRMQNHPFRNGDQFPVLLRKRCGL